MKKYLSVITIVTLMVAAGCEKTKDAPVVTSPQATNVETGKSVDLTFAYTAGGGFSSSEIGATGGDAVIKSDGVSGSGSGNIVVTFNAGTTAGSGSVTVTVKDNEGQSGKSTAVINIEEVPAISVNSNITVNQTWETGNIYILEGRITVVSGVTLTIEPGVIVKGREGSEANATALLIARGGKLMAEGTAEAPIIFTSVSDRIIPGQIESPNLGSSINGLWGGVLVLGKAPVSADAEAMQIEGIPASDLNGLYGGSDPADNSGVLKYISIRHGGANIGEGNEINGLTLGGVGSGTTIENIEIVANQDDGIEFFGGTVNVKNVVVLNTGDDAIDTDQSWNGSLDNCIIINPGDECFELDGPEGAMAAKHTISNASISAGDAEGLVDLDPNSYLDMNNIYFFNLKPGQDFDELPTIYTCNFTNFQVTLPTGSAVADFFKGGSDQFTTAVNAGANTVGADKTKFTGWSWTAVSGSLNDF